jgi:hypothetical protein
VTDFKFGTPYPIDTLPDDIHDANVAPSDWLGAPRRALFWNDCQGWWHESIGDYWLLNRFDHMAEFWMPEPPDPVSLEEQRKRRLSTT